MRLDEALARRADLHTRMYEVQAGLLENAALPGSERQVVTEALLTEYRRLHEEHQDLDARIEETNWEDELRDFRAGEPR